MTDTARVHVTVDDGLAVVTLDNVARRNALTLAMARELREALAALAADDAVGALVVRGAGGTFCSGIDTDVIEHLDDPAADEPVRRATLVYGSFAALAEQPFPTFAAVRGAAVGAGLNLALAADLRIVARDARLLAGFTRLRLHPGGGFFTLASRLLGREAAMALGVVGEELDGERAAARGFAWRALPDEQVEDEALRLARRCADDPELARATVASLRHEAGASLPLQAAIELERGRQMWTFRRRAARDGR